MTMYDYNDICCDCKDLQTQKVIFDAHHPISKVQFSIEYCPYLNAILTDEMKYVVSKLDCEFCRRY